MRYGFVNGRPDEIFRPVNGDGQLCGVGELADYPKLYYLLKANDKNFYAVCVDECPRKIRSQIKCHGTRSVHADECMN